MLDKSLIFDVITAAMGNGADFAEVFVENKKNTSISYSNKTVEDATSGVDFGLGIRIIKGFNTVYTYTNDLRRDNLLKFAKDASSALAHGEMIAPKMLVDIIRPDYSKIKIYPTDVLLKSKIDKMIVGHDTIMSYDELIKQASMRYIDMDQFIQIANSDGLFVEDRRTHTRYYCTAIAELNGELQTGFIGPGAAKGFELFDDIKVEDAAREAARIATTMVKASYAPSGVMPVVMENAFGGVLFHEACGHGLEAEFVSKDSSVFAGKLGKKIASDVVNAVDDGTIPNQWGTLNVDDEGTPTQRNLLIENGILKSYLVDNLNGKRMGMKSTGSSRRESYKYAPTSRMNNTFITDGKSTREEIIAATEYGLYAKNLLGGSVDVVTGEFNFAVMEGYMIENGKITRPVRGASLVGTGLEVLQKIDMVGNDLKLAEGWCGASSGSIPAGVGQPPVRISGLTVGGRD